ncbi:hypothetical protein [Oceanispirochaeta sp.]|jgi:hypothetical protein|uniref:hypothetical protein n=1 Tax=Oceanispirochaeta sp. TaxID=2035350 RepID=UPI0026133312|nr:hypothetical protein [Oceanispirochaeta sp.]MDA3958068.1 hypothetical protein [Oceanispirochaeta sp.]
MDASDSLSRFYKNLTDGKTSTLRKMFVDQPWIDTPLSGSLRGDAGLAELMDNEGSWMRNHLISVELVSQIKDEKRIAVELRLYAKINGEKKDLPVILIGDLQDDLFDQIRIYHSTWPINGRHSYRAPLVWPEAELRKPEIINEYISYLTKQDYNKILALFTENAFIQEPSGLGFIHQGPEAREAFFIKIMADGPLGITHSAVLQDQKHFCAEYICNSWGKLQFEPMAGCTVYGLTEQKDKLTAIRVYDDITVPGETNLIIPPLD